MDDFALELSDAVVEIVQNTDKSYNEVIKQAMEMMEVQEGEKVELS